MTIIAHQPFHMPHQDQSDEIGSSFLTGSTELKFSSSSLSATSTGFGSLIAVKVAPSSVFLALLGVLAVSSKLREHDLHFKSRQPTAVIFISSFSTLLASVGCTLRSLGALVKKF